MPWFNGDVNGDCTHDTRTDGRCMVGFECCDDDEEDENEDSEDSEDADGSVF
jgi:hypothetical protein